MQEQAEHPDTQKTPASRAPKVLSWFSPMYDLPDVLLVELTAFTHCHRLIRAPKGQWVPKDGAAPPGLSNHRSPKKTTAW